MIMKDGMFTVIKTACKKLKKQYALIHTACSHVYYSVCIYYFVSMSRLLRVRRRRYSSPACMIRISRPRAKRLLECSIGSECAVSLLRVNKLKGAFMSVDSVVYSERFK